MSSELGKNQSVVEMTVDIPADGVTIRTGFGLDIGGSLAKLAYATDEVSFIRLHFASFPRDQPEIVTSYLKDKINGKIPEDCTVYTCGLGVAAWRKTMERELKVKLHNWMEMELFVNGFQYSTKVIPATKQFYPIPEKATQYANRFLYELQALSSAMHDQGAASSWEGMEQNEEKVSDAKENGTKKHDEAKKINKTAASEENAAADDIAPVEANVKVDDANTMHKVEYPILLCMLGSGAAFMKVNEDGSHLIVEGSSRCGRMFMGLGKLLTGAKNYKELEELSVKGIHENVNTMGKHMKIDDKEDMYSAFPESAPFYSFGQATESDKVKSGFAHDDIAAALLNNLAQDIAQTSHLTAMAHNIGSMYFCGGFVGLSEIVREHLAMFMELRSKANSLNMNTKYHFLRFGGYFGALGALLKTLGIKANGPTTEKGL